MRRLKFLLPALAVAALAPLTGCLKGKAQGPRTVGTLLPSKTAKAKGNGPVTPEQDAVLRVLEWDKEAFKAGFDSLQVDSQPSAFVKMMAEFDDRFHKADLACCPAEFRAARSRYIKSWEKLRAVLGKFPDAYEDVEFMDAIGALFRHDRAKGRKLGGEVMDAVEQLHAAYAEMYTSAEGYGIDVDDR